jgi:DNA-binding transcriptional MerR regulator
MTTVTEGELPLVRRGGKSEAAFRTISEVADELDVPQHVLRFWESKFPQVKPLKRGGGRRYYRPEDVLLLRRIRDLLYAEGYTIKGVQKLLKEGGAAAREAGIAVPPANEAELSFSEDEADDGEPSAGQAGDTAEPASPSQPAAFAIRDDTGSRADREEAADRGALTPFVRHQLQELLADLEQLRGLLHKRER